MAAFESFGYFSSQESGNSLPLLSFLGLYAHTSGVILATMAFSWLAIWFFMVWLGGVRPGIALLFMLIFFTMFEALIVLLDIPLSHATGDTPWWDLLAKVFALFALAAATFTSLVFAKVTRSFRPMHPTPRLLSVAGLLLTGLAFAVWARNAHFGQIQSALYWGAFTVASLLAALVFWFLFGTKRRRTLVMTAVAVAFCVPMVANQPLQPPSHPSRMDALSTSHRVKRVLLITVDTLRQDSLGTYRAGVQDTPRIDAFARDNAVFTNAFSAAPWTYPSVTTILTGMAPRVHMLSDTGGTLPNEVPTLAEAMDHAGYRTGACGSNSVLSARSRLNRGFREYCWFPRPSLTVQNFEVGLAHNLLDLCGIQDANAEQLTDRTLEWIRANAQTDFFFWVHYFDPHTPYSPPEAYQPTDPTLRKMGRSFIANKAARLGTFARTPQEQQWVRALYDGEVRHVDAQIGRLFDALREMGLYDDTLIVLTSDHGEEFWDHDRFEHGHTLYNELLRVPLVIKLPGADNGAAIDTCVSLQAVTPTVLDLCGAPPSRQDILLPPLSPLLQSPQAACAEMPAFSGACLFFGHMESVVYGPMKYIRGTDSGHEMLFNLKDDPGEQHSLVVQDPQNLEKGRRLLEEARTSDDQIKGLLGIHTDGDEQVNQEQMRALQALGYL